LVRGRIEDIGLIGGEGRIRTPGIAFDVYTRSQACGVKPEAACHHLAARRVSMIIHAPVRVSPEAPVHSDRHTRLRLSTICHRVRAMLGDDEAQCDGRCSLKAMKPTPAASRRIATPPCGQMHGGGAANHPARFTQKFAGTIAHKAKWSCKVIEQHQRRERLSYLVEVLCSILTMPSN